jgi:hypothetical protein
VGVEALNLRIHAKKRAAAPVKLNPRLDA